MDADDGDDNDSEMPGLEDWDNDDDNDTDEDPLNALSDEEQVELMVNTEAACEVITKVCIQTSLPVFYLLPLPYSFVPLCLQ